jgi:hypothetical protein
MRVSGPGGGSHKFSNYGSTTMHTPEAGDDASAD